MAEYADEAIQKIKAAVEERKADQKAAKKARKSVILELINAARAKNTQERLIHLSLMTPENLNCWKPNNCNWLWMIWIV